MGIHYIGALTSSPLEHLSRHMRATIVLIRRCGRECLGDLKHRQRPRIRCGENRQQEKFVDDENFPSTLYAFYFQLVTALKSQRAKNEHQHAPRLRAFRTTEYLGISDRTWRRNDLQPSFVELPKSGSINDVVSKGRDIFASIAKIDLRS